MSEEFGFRPGAELADILISLYGLVPQLEAVLRAFGADTTDVECADHVVEVIELERPARCIGQVDRLERAHELVAVAGVAAERFQGSIDDLAIDVEQRGILA